MPREEGWIDGSEARSIESLCPDCGRFIRRADRAYYFGKYLYHEDCDAIEDFSFNRAQILGEVHEILVIEQLERLGFSCYRSTATGEYDLLAAYKQQFIRIEVRTLRRAKGGSLLFSHGDRHVPCDFYIGVLRYPPNAAAPQFFIVPSEQYRGVASRKWLGQWQLLFGVSYLIKWLVRPEESRFASRLDPVNWSGRLCLLGIEWEGEIDIFLGQILKRYKITFMKFGEERCYWRVIKEIDETLLHELIHSFGFPSVVWERPVLRLAGELVADFGQGAASRVNREHAEIKIGKVATDRLLGLR